MNLGQWALLWLGLAVLGLTSGLIAGLVQPSPNLGGIPPTFYGNSTGNWIVAATCSQNVSITPQANRNASNAFFYQLGPGDGPVDPRSLSQLVWVWAQFIQHDLFLFSTSSGNYNISLGSSYMSLSPLAVNSANCSSTNGRTPLIDGSPIYSDAVNPGRLALLRSGNFGTLTVGQGANLPIVNGQFLAGDVNVNENPQLVSIVNLFVREHNWWCGQLRQIYPWWTDDQLFWKARSYVIVEIQRITMEEWLPILLGGYLGINPPLPITLVFPKDSTWVSAEFASIGSEFYRSQLNNDMTYNVSNVTSTVLSISIDNLLLASWQSPALLYDVHVSQTQCNNSQAFDYITADLTRCQELGITPSYVQLCQTFGTSPFNMSLMPPLASVWNEAPPGIPGGSLQLTNIAILVDQLTRTFANDPFLVQVAFNGCKCRSDILPNAHINHFGPDNLPEHPNCPLFFLHIVNECFLGSTLA